MVRNYIRKTKRESYSAKALNNALHAVRSGALSKKRASRDYGIPCATLINRLKNPDSQPTFIGRFKPIFDAAFEQELVQHVLEIQVGFFGLSWHDLRSLAFEIGEKTNYSILLIKSTAAGKAWAQGLIKLVCDVRKQPVCPK